MKYKNKKCNEIMAQKLVGKKNNNTNKIRSRQ